MDIKKQFLNQVCKLQNTISFTLQSLLWLIIILTMAVITMPILIALSVIFP